MNVIIFGSTGNTGRQVVTQALEQGHQVTAFARSAEKLGLRHENLRVVQGDVLDFPAVEAAVAGQDAVICTLGAPPRDKNHLRERGTENILRAMENTGVRRLVAQSTVGIGDSHDALPFHMKYILVPLLLGRAFADHAKQEERIRESQADWTIVRPAALKEGKYTGSYQVDYTADNHNVTSNISYADTAEFMLKQLADSTYVHRTPSLSY